MTASTSVAETERRWSPTGTKRRTVVAALAGILFVILSLARVPLTGEIGLPYWGASTPDVTDFYKSLTFDTAFIVGIGMVTIGWLLYLVFIAKFATIVGSVDSGSSWVGNLIVSLAVVSVASTATYLIAVSTGANLANAGGIGSDSFLILHGAANGAVWFSFVTGGLRSAVMGVAILISRAFPRWLGLALLAAASLQVFTFFGPVDMWTAVSGLVYPLTLLLAIAMLMRSNRYSTSNHSTMSHQS
ncbi:MAG: hypothetical protein PVF87_03415 [Acidimicrobiia bacterium]